MSLRRLLISLVLPFALLAAAPSRAEPLVADLSDHLVRITTGFTGAQVLLFGAVDGPGQIVVLVQGPPETVVVRRKDRVAGIWMNVDEATFGQVPAFYKMLSSEPLGEWLPLQTREGYGIGAEYLDFTPVEAIAPAKAADFRDALIRQKRARGHYGAYPGRIALLGSRLFRADVFFPANLPPGNYNITVLLIRNGEVASAQQTPLFVSKAGLGADVYRIAHEQPAMYGIAAIVIAVLAGLAGNAIFRKA